MGHRSSLDVAQVFLPGEQAVYNSISPPPVRVAVTSPTPAASAPSKGASSSVVPARLKPASSILERNVANACDRLTPAQRRAEAWVANGMRQLENYQNVAWLYGGGLMLRQFTNPLFLSDMASLSVSVLSHPSLGLRLARLPILSAVVDRPNIVKALSFALIAACADGTGSEYRIGERRDGGGSDATTTDVVSNELLPSKDPEPYVELVSVGLPSYSLNAYGNSDNPSVNKDGRYVVFESDGFGLVEVPTGGRKNVFLRDRDAQATTLIGVKTDGTVPNGESSMPHISADGTCVVFTSSASNLVSGDTNGASDTFLFHLKTGALERVSVSSTGVQGNAYSGEGYPTADCRYVLFSSSATNLVPNPPESGLSVYLRDQISGTTELVSFAPDGSPFSNPSVQISGRSISAEGRYVAYVATPSDDSSIYVYDRVTRVVEEIEKTSSGIIGQGSDGYTDEVALASNGRYAVFSTAASNLVLEDTNGYRDVFVKDRGTGMIERVSVSPSGAQANGPSHRPSISSDERFVVFTSYASNLVPGDTNGHSDIFVHDRHTHMTKRISVGPGEIQFPSDSVSASLSADGHFVTYRNYFYRNSPNSQVLIVGLDYFFEK